MIAAFESQPVRCAHWCSSPCLLPCLDVRSKRPCAVGQSSGFHSWSTKEILLVPFWCSLEVAHAEEPDGRLSFHTDYAVELIGFELHGIRRYGMCFMHHSIWREPWLWPVRGCSRGCFPGLFSRLPNEGNVRKMNSYSSGCSSMCCGTTL